MESCRLFLGNSLIIPPCRKLLETKLSCWNLIKGINTWAVPLRYSGPFLKWTRDELKQMDQRTRKLMTIHKALHPRDIIDWLYVSRKEGGRGLANHIKVRIDKTQQNSKCRLHGDRDKTINHIISECSKLAQKEYKTRNNWVGKVIHWEMCKKFKFDHMNKWDMHNPAPVLENNPHKLLWDFDIHTDHLISARRPDLIIINNRELAKLLTLLSQLTTE